MQNTSLSPREPLGTPGITSSSAVAWSAILGGAFGAIALSLVLLILGSGLGLSILAPGPHPGATAVKVTSAIVGWLIFTQWVSSALGGYLAGRLRSKYVSVHTDEVFFRDTAHGFLAWSVASIITAALFALVAASGVKGGAHLMAAGMEGAAHSGPGMERPMGPPPMGGPGDPHMYLVDALFRSDHPAPGASDMEVRGETTRILLNGIKNGDVPQADRTYLAQVVAAHASISPDEAAKRVNDTITQMQTEEEQAKQAAESARKTAATLSVFTFLSLLIGAFAASVAGALGGKRRDEYALY